MREVLAQQNDTVDAICWRHYGVTEGMVELVLEANPGLAALGPILSHGTCVLLPSRPASAPSSPLIQLWD